MSLTRALQSVSTFDAEVYEELQVDAESLMKEYEKRAKDAGVADVHIVIEMGNPKTLLARTIPMLKKWTSSLLAQLVSTPLNASWSVLHLNTFSAMLRSICWLWENKRKLCNNEEKELSAPFVYYLY